MKRERDQSFGVRGERNTGKRELGIRRVKYGKKGVESLGIGGAKCGKKNGIMEENAVVCETARE